MIDFEKGIVVTTADIAAQRKLRSDAGKFVIDSPPDILGFIKWSHTVSKSAESHRENINSHRDYSESFWLPEAD